MSERDFTQVTLKVNCSGSWANLLVCPSEHYDEVKAACVILATAAGQRVKFKALDAAGGLLEEYGPLRNGGLYGWHEPKGRRS